MALSTPSLLSCRSVCLVNPIRFAPSTRRFRARPFRWNPCRPNRKFFSGMWEAQGYQFADRSLPGGTAKNRSLAIDFCRRRPIEGEIDRRPIEEEKGQKKKRKRRKKKSRRNNTALYLPVRRRRPPIARARRQNVSPRGEKDRGD
ncbi:hypothetical protein BHE74_00055179, partial [Ensete ventricosum]